MILEEIKKIDNVYDLPEIDRDYAIEKFKEGFTSVELCIQDPEDENNTIRGWAYQDSRVEILG